MSLRNVRPAARSRSTSAAMSSTMKWMRFHPPGAGVRPSGIARPAELLGPLSSRRRLPRTPSAKAGAALNRSVNPKGPGQKAIAFSTSSTMYRTLTNSSGTFGHLLGGCVDGLDQEADARLDLGRGALERGQRLPIAPGLTCRVGDAPMDRRRGTREL